MNEFSKSQEAAWRRLVRNIIRKADLNRAEREVILAVANQWLHHRNGPEKCIYPGREKLAKQAKCSVATVKRALALLRDSGVLVPMGSLHGGHKATRYRVRMIPLFELCGAELPDWMDGDLVERPQAPRGEAENTQRNGSNRGPKRAKETGHHDPRYIYTFKPCLSQSIGNDNSPQANPVRNRIGGGL